MKKKKKRKIPVKGPNPYKLVKGKGIGPVLEIYFMVNQLKHLYRKGYLRHISKKQCESVADHVFGVMILVVLVNDFYNLKLDLEKALLMVLFHELGEVVIGDITPFDGISKKKKHKLEKKGVRKIFKNFPGKKKYFVIWDEFEEGKTPEARIVILADKFEMGPQSKIYGELYARDLSEFQRYLEEVLEDKTFLSLLGELKKI